MNDKGTGSLGSLDAPQLMCKYGYALSHSEETIVHSGQVRAAQFGTSPKMCVAKIFTEFRVDVNSYITSQIRGKYSL